MTTRIHPVSLPFQLPINAEASVDQAKQALSAGATIEDITRETLGRMGFDPPPVMPLTIATVKAHLG